MSDNDTRVRRGTLVIDGARKHRGRYWDAYDYMTDDSKKEFDAILCNHCTWQSGKQGKSAQSSWDKYCNYALINCACRHCTPFECIPKGFFKQKGYRPADTEKMQKAVEDFVDRLGG